MSFARSSETAILPSLIEELDVDEIELVVIASATDSSVEETARALRSILDSRPSDFPAVTLRVVRVPVDLVNQQAAAAELVGAVVVDELLSEDFEVVINVLPGPTHVKSVLVSLASLIGIEVVSFERMHDDEPGNLVWIPTAPTAPDPREILRRLDLARAIVDASPDDDADTLIRDARSHGVGNLVQQVGDTVVLSRFASVLDELTTQPRPHLAHAATAAMLRNVAALRATTDREDDGFGLRQVAEDLETCVGSWVEQRLWSINLVPELVVHDDRHVERVDWNTAQITSVLFGGIDSNHVAAISIEEVVALSAAAWLHDWGHVGASLPRGFVDQPAHVRVLHGLLSQRLIEMTRASHGLAEPIASIAGVLCAHHQGISSCDEHAPDPTGPLLSAARYYGAEKAVRSLEASAGSLGMSLERLRYLVTILRVADAADVGEHRIPDYGRRRFESLALSVIRTTQRTRQALGPTRADDGFRAVLDQFIGELTSAIGSERDSGAGMLVFDNLIERMANEERRLRLDGPDLPNDVSAYFSYVRQLAGRAFHDDLHANVRSVRLRWRKDSLPGFRTSRSRGKPTTTGVLVPVVNLTPRACTSELQADTVTRVDELIQAELARPHDPESSHLRHSLDRVGIEVASAVSSEEWSKISSD